jgi:hypothetical protein
MKESKFVIKERERISKLSNRVLFDEYSGSCGGDEPDGTYSVNLFRTYAILNDEIERRLAAWLS